MKPSSQTASALPPSAAPKPIHVVLVIASKFERLGWSIVVDSQEDMEVVGQFSSFTPALAFFTGHAVDVALIDEAMLTPAAGEALQKLTGRRLPHLLMMAPHPVDPTHGGVHRCLVSSRLLKGLSAAELLLAIRDAVRSDLTAGTRGMPGH